VSESLNQQIDRLEELYRSEKDPQGRAFVPLAEAHRRLGDLGKALTVIQEGLGAHPDFASAHMVAGWVYRSRKEPDDAMRSFKRVVELDAENSLAQAAIAELIDDQRPPTYRDKMAVKKEAEQSAVATADDERLVVPIASLAPAVPDATTATPPVAPESVSDGAPRLVVPIASLAPADHRPMVHIASLAPDATIAAAPLPNGAGRPVMPILSLAPDRDDAGGEIYTQTLAELYASQGAVDNSIEVYRKLIAADPDNQALIRRVAELESLEPGSLGVHDARRTVPIESLAPDG
jgi:tetratricopeptide (TPR) repeat protein